MVVTINIQMGINFKKQNISPSKNNDEEEMEESTQWREGDEKQSLKKDMKWKTHT